MCRHPRMSSTIILVLFLFLFFFFLGNRGGGEREI